MNAPSPALVAPRPERLRLVGQRRQLLAIMHQRLMFGMLVFAGMVAIIALRILYLAAFGDHAGARKGDRAHSRPRRHRRPRRRAARADDRRLDDRGPPEKGDRRQARARAAPRPADARAQRGAIFRAAAARASHSSISAAALRRTLVEAVNAIGEPGLALEREPDRLYPQTSLAAHVIGFTEIDGHGGAGIERAFDNYLSDPRDPRQAAGTFHLQPRPAGARARAWRGACTISPRSAPRAW